MKSLGLGQNPFIGDISACKTSNLPGADVGTELICSTREKISAKISKFIHDIQM
jgi:hypothetical protein